MSRHGRAIKFIQTYCRSPKGAGFGKPLKLGDWLYIDNRLAEVM